MKSLSAIGVIALGLAVCGLNVLVLGFTQPSYVESKPPPHPAAYRIPSPYRMYPDGHLYTASIPSSFDQFADEDVYDQRSLALVYEDDRLLPLPRTQGFLIAQKGLGRYSHQKQRVYFSSSDNTDPRTNGRAYWFVLRDRKGEVINVVKGKPDPN